MRKSITIPDELMEHIEMFKKDNNQTTRTAAIIKLLELGLIRYREDKEIEKYLIQIIKQNNYLINLIEDFVDEAKS